MTSTFEYPFEMMIGSATYPAKFVPDEHEHVLNVEVDGVQFSYAEDAMRACIMGDSDEQRRVADRIRAKLKITSEASALFFDMIPNDAYELAHAAYHQD